MKWRLVRTPRAEKDLPALDAINARRIERALRRFSVTGHGDIRRLTNLTPEASRIRVGDYRVILELHEDRNEAQILRVRRRDSAYRPRLPAPPSPGA